MLKRIAFCGLVGLLVSTTSAFANLSWNAVSDFPTVTGPTTPAQSTDGVWLYGYSPTLNPVNFTQDTTATTDYFGDGKAAGFYTPTSGTSYGPYNLPTVLQNISGGNLNEGSITNWPTTLLLLHPGPSGDYSVVRFIAPTSATYVISGIFTAIDSGNTADTASVTTSGPSSTLLYSTNSTSAPHTFTFNQALTAGESLDFAVGWGVNNQFDNDSTGFDATITATPEPGLYGVLALGLTALVVAVCRRKADVVRIENETN